MPQIIDNRNSLDNTIKIFDAFYDLNLIINPNEYDIAWLFCINM